MFRRLYYLLTNQPSFTSFLVPVGYFSAQFSHGFFLNWVNGPLDSWSFNKFVQVWWKPFKKTRLHFLHNIFIHVKKVKKEHLKYIIRFYYVKYFVELFKSGFSIGTLNALYIASLNCHWNCLKNIRCWLRILGDSSYSSANISDEFVAYGSPWTKCFYCYGDKVIVISKIWFFP